MMKLLIINILIIQTIIQLITDHMFSKNFLSVIQKDQNHIDSKLPLVSSDYAKALINRNLLKKALFL